MKASTILEDVADRSPQMPRPDIERSKIRGLDAEEAAALIKVDMDRRTPVRWARLDHVPATLSARASDGSDDSLKTNSWNGLKNPRSRASSRRVARLNGSDLLRNALIVLSEGDGTWIAM